MKLPLAVLSAFAVLYATYSPLSAHAIPLACLPRIGSSVTSPPAQLICQFSDPLDANNISMTVTDGNGQRVDGNDVRFYEGDTHTLVVSLDAAKMGQGIYSVKWQVLDTVDRGLTNGEFQFGVNRQVPPTPTAVLPGAPLSPPPTTGNAIEPTEMIASFLIVVGVVALVAVGILFRRMQKSGTTDPGEIVE
jgi:methionine-rich copper-binding protein CopC